MKNPGTPYRLEMRVRSWWWTGKPGRQQSIGSQSVRQDWATELNWRRGSWLLAQAVWACLSQSVHHHFCSQKTVQLANASGNPADAPPVNPLVCPSAHFSSQIKSSLTFLICFQLHGDNIRASIGLTHGQGSDVFTTYQLQEKPQRVSLRPEVPSRGSLGLRLAWSCDTPPSPLRSEYRKSPRREALYPQGWSSLSFSHHFLCKGS